MSRLAGKSPALCTDKPLEQIVLRDKLALLRQLLKSCFGPTGRLKHVRNNIGGRVVTTSTSSVLLSAISSTEPLLNLIKASVLNHVSRFGDCGLFSAILCLSLIERATRSGLRTRVAVGVNAHLLGLCTAYLRGDACGCKVKLDFCSSRDSIKLALGVISSKAACVLTRPEALHVSTLAVEAFLLTVPRDVTGAVTLGRVVTVSAEGHSVLDSAVFPGLLVDVPDDFAHGEPERVHADPPRVVLFGASLAGDLSELGDGTIEARRGEADADSQILDQLLGLGKRAVEDEVKLFVCQKVVHPVLQRFLRDHGVMVIQRLGGALMEPLSRLTGAQPVATLHRTVPAGAYGRLRGVRTRRFGSKTMLHLQPLGDSSICTLGLCHRNETMLSELKVACQKAEQVLRLTLREPSALHGGGCTETHLAAHVRHQSLKDVAEVASALRCSRAECSVAVEGFCAALDSVAAALEHDGGASLIDLTHAHRWAFPADGTKEHAGAILSLCGCGLVKSSPDKKWTYLNTKSPHFSPAPPSRDASLQPRVLDSFTAKVNAMQVAVETANLALDVQFIIQDVN
ncbi:molecular chaperone MKKS [Brachionichthys hirsutus]|uniref:molecular chaperone MKKS n=1 Tax=Brachionichthys hirsutus TaxID=412623 RepID=UPI0036049E4F